MPDVTIVYRQLCLLGGIGLAQVTDFVATGVQLGTQALLGQLRGTQALVEQCKLSGLAAELALQLPD